LAVDGDRSKRQIEFKTEFLDRGRNRLGEEFDEAGCLRRCWPCDGAGAMIAKGGESETASAAKLGVAQVAAVEGVEDLAPPSGSAGAGHAEQSR